MSIESWKKEFYVEELPKDDDELEATKNCLKKWEGLREESLKKHGITITKLANLIDSQENRFYIDADTCQLCRIIERELNSCEDCPIYEAIGKDCCNEFDENFEEELPFEESIYGIWRKKQNPEPMIEALKRTIEYLQ